MSYKGYYSNPNNRFKRDLTLAAVIIPIIAIFYFVGEYWDIIKEWLTNIFN